MAISSSKITDVAAREVLDSRGRPTVEVDVRVESGHIGRAIAPSGASTGAAEALELRDGDERWYRGLGVERAVGNVREIIRPAILGMDSGAQFDLDRRLNSLDPTDNKSQLGANAILAVSLASAHAAAAARDIPLFAHIAEMARSIDLVGSDQPPAMPLPMTNMISGGLHAGGRMDFQDVLVEPRGIASYRDQLEALVRIYWQLGRVLMGAGLEGYLVGDEGGYGPAVENPEQAIQLTVRAIEEAGFAPGSEITVALDVAASHFFEDGHYQLSGPSGGSLDAAAMVDHLESLVNAYPIRSIEDGLAEEDWAGWQKLQRRLGDRIQIVGDDLFATNPQRVQQGIDQQCANALLVKPNQIGTLSETLETMRLARAAGFALVVSARSGETEDTTIADLAVGTCAEQIKIGSVARSERLAKYNRLLRIEELLTEENDRRA